MIKAESSMIFTGTSDEDWQVIVNHVKLYQDSGYTVELYPLLKVAKIYRKVDNFNV